MSDVDSGTCGEGGFDVSWDEEEGGCVGREDEGSQGGLGGEVCAECSLVRSDWLGGHGFGF